METDVVVLGSGAAGLVAALAADEQGASVALFEKGDMVGGTTASSGGLFGARRRHACGGVAGPRHPRLPRVRCRSA